VGRGLCLYRWEDFSNLPKNRRSAALALKLPLWSPFETTGHHCVWSGGAAMVWLWDASRVASRGPEGRADDQRLRIVPETVFLPRQSDGVFVQPCFDGFELQFWQDDALRDSIWFEDRPTDAVVASFLTRHHVSAQSAVLAPGPTGAFSTEPWRVPVSPKEWLQANEGRLVAASVLTLTLVIVGLETRIWSVHHEARAAAAQLAGVEDELGPLLAERTAFLNLRRLNEGMAAILAEPSQALLMALVDETIPSATATFEAWTYQRPELTVVVEDETLDPVAYVESLEEEPRFDDVGVQLVRGGDQLEVTVGVSP